MSKISIVEYQPSDSPELLRLLLELHKTYFQKTSSKKIQELKKERGVKKSYRNYIATINGDNWKTYLAVSAKKGFIGFIIGSITNDHELVKNNIGIIEDWFVEDNYRKKGIGKQLYNKLEKWFKQKGCHQVISDTWSDYKLSIEAHKKLGFFVSGFSFSKKLK